jgi:hypothetical protein
MVKYKELEPTMRVRVTWIDAQNRADWHAPEELEALGLNSLVITEALVYKRVKAGVLLYSSKSTDGQQYGGCMFIPRVCIKRIERLP